MVWELRTIKYRGCYTHCYMQHLYMAVILTHAALLPQETGAHIVGTVYGPAESDACPGVRTLAGRDRSRCAAESRSQVICMKKSSMFDEN